MIFCEREVNILKCYLQINENKGRMGAGSNPLYLTCKASSYLTYRLAQNDVISCQAFCVWVTLVGSILHLDKGQDRTRADMEAGGTFASPQMPGIMLLANQEPD